MPTPADIKQPGFFKRHLLPALTIFLIPLFSLWFFERAEMTMDENILNQLRNDINNAASLTPDQKQAEISFFEATPVSKIMNFHSDEYKNVKPMFSQVSFDYLTFRACRYLAIGSLAAAAAGLVIVGIAVGWSLRSQAAQYRSLVITWPILKAISVIEVVFQAVLAVALSFWVTALWFEVYSVKLVGAIGVLAGIAVLVIIRGIFLKADGRFEIAGEEISPQQAPELWERVRGQALKLGTAPPDRIVAGIDANFYVTEHPVILNGESKPGRTLFVSLPLLKVLTTDEADAVLGHEMAHFSGEDTLWSSKLGPLLDRIRIYLIHLSNGGLTVVAFHFLHVFWKLYQVSLGKLSREREFRADKIGAELSTPGALARSLVKISAYCDYRDSVETDILAKQRLADDLHLADSVETGFPNHLRQFVSAPNFEAETPHPFDSHPPLSRRFKNLGLEPTTALSDPVTLAPVASSWAQQISDASALESRLWDSREKLIQHVHQTQLSWRLMPVDEESIKIISEAFPERIFPFKKGGQAVMDYEKIVLPDGVVIRWEEVETLTVNGSTLRGKVIGVKWKTPAAKKSTNTRIATADYRAGASTDEFFLHLGNYYGRYRSAKEFSAA
jgi:Zn-dependent protease with chaperone function